MFQNKKSRFQNVNFTKKLDQARNYNRLVKKQNLTPKPKWVKVLIKTGAFLFILAIIYLLFIPNFLFIKSIKVAGLPANLNQKVVEITHAYLNQSKWYKPEKNQLLFNKVSYKDYLLKQLPELSENTTVKILWFKQEIIVETHLEDQIFLIKSNDKLWLGNQAGLIEEFSQYNDINNWLEIRPDLLKIQYQGIELNSGNTIFSDKEIRILSTVNQQINEKIGQGIKYISVKKDLDYIEVYLSKNDTTSFYFVKFNFSEDTSEAVEKLSLLLQQTPPDRYLALYYIDMRFKDRSFVCLLGSPCVKDINEEKINQTKDEQEVSNEHKQ